MVEQHAAADEAAYAAVVQALHRQQTEAVLARGGRPLRYVEHRIEAGLVATRAGGQPHRVLLPFVCGTAIGIVVGVQSGSIDHTYLWYRLAHTMGGSDQWSAITPIGQAQTSWRLLTRDQLGIARFFGPFADAVAVELSPHHSNSADSLQSEARWEGTTIFAGVTTQD